MAELIYTTEPTLAILKIASAYSSVFVLTDENAHKHCFPVIQNIVPEENLIIVKPGESAKSLEGCTRIWQRLSDKEADRRALLINLGGGMITDLGGFAASVYKRGINFINVPTSLLGMVDAAIGGKTGINFQYYKNQIGSFSDARATITYAAFLDSLPQREYISGYAEMLKYGLIADKDLWDALKDFMAIPRSELPLSHFIGIKLRITKADPYEKGSRKLLNFGHTFGHAFESYAMKNGMDLMHGEAVAAGMIAESFLSMKKGKLNEAGLEEIVSRIKELYSQVSIPHKDIPAIIEIMRQDKKNVGGNFRLVLLDSIGSARYDIECTEAEVQEALGYYSGLN